MSEELSDSILLTRAKMLNLKSDGPVFKPGVHVGVTEGDTVYKAKILSVDWPNMQVVVHFLNFNKRFDKAISMSEVCVWRVDSERPNEFKRSVNDRSRLQRRNSVSELITSTPSHPRTVLGESEHNAVRDKASSHNDSTGDVGESGSVKCSTCGCRVENSRKVS